MIVTIARHSLPRERVIQLRAASTSIDAARIFRSEVASIRHPQPVSRHRMPALDTKLSTDCTDFHRTAVGRDRVGSGQSTEWAVRRVPRLPCPAVRKRRTTNHRARRFGWLRRRNRVRTYKRMDAPTAVHTAGQASSGTGAQRMRAIRNANSAMPLLYLTLFDPKNAPGIHSLLPHHSRGIRSSTRGHLWPRQSR